MRTVKLRLCHSCRRQKHHQCSDARIYFPAQKPLKRLLQPNRSTQRCASNCTFCRSYKGQLANACLIKNAIYKVTCLSCLKVYIGETSRQMKVRLKEHLCSDKSLVFQHFSACIGKENTKYEWTILQHRLPNYNIRLNTEAIYIAKNQHNLINGCCGTQFSSVSEWLHISDSTL